MWGPLETLHGLGVPLRAALGAAGSTRCPGLLRARCQPGFGTHTESPSPSHTRDLQIPALSHPRAPHLAMILGLLGASTVAW